MLNAHIRARIVSLDEENPISLTADEMQKEIQEAAVGYYTKYNQCKVHAYELHHMPSYGCTKDGDPLYCFQCVIVVNFGKRWEHAVDVNLTCTKSKTVETKPGSWAKYDVWHTWTDFSRQGKDATDPEKPIPQRPEITRETIQIQP